LWGGLIKRGDYKTIGRLKSNFDYQQSAGNSCEFQVSGFEENSRQQGSDQPERSCRLSVGGEK
jgi:hypothetical protein